jgi:hypothetical protein
MVNDYRMIPVEGKPDHGCSVGQTSKNCHNIDAHHQSTLYLWGHGDIVEQGVADSSLSILCHGCQHVALSKCTKQKELCHTSRIGDDILLPYKVSQEFGD